MRAFCSLVVVAIACGLWGGTARAEMHFTTPVPTFEAALAAAKQAGKPLVVEFSATWCSPCKLLARDLAKPRAKAASDLIYLVVYDGSEEDVGSALMNKLGANGFPTLVAFDSDGQEASRREGYGTWAALESWLKDLPEQAVSLAALQKSADAAPKDGKLQLSLARRLLALERYDEAGTYFGRAHKSTDKEIAAPAAWTLLQLELRNEERKAARKSIEQLAAQFPGTAQADKALAYLAALPNPPVALLEGLLVKQLQELKEPGMMNSLAYSAMKAGANKAALKIADKLEPLSKEKPGSQETLAEIAFYVEGNVDKAVKLANQALENAKGAQRGTLNDSIERYRRNKKEPSPDLQNFRSPRLALSPPDRHLPARVNPLTKAATKLEKAIRDGCWQQAANLNEGVRVIVATGAKPAENRALFAANSPPAWTACTLKLIQSAELPDGEIVTLRPDLAPLAVGEQVDTAKAAAEDGCLTQAGKLRNLTVAISVEIGKPPSLAFPNGKAAPTELRTCVEKAFASLKPARPLLQTVSLHFGED